MAKLITTLNENTVDELIKVLKNYKGKKISIMGSNKCLVHIEDDYIILDEVNLEEDDHESM